MLTCGLHLRRLRQTTFTGWHVSQTSSPPLLSFLTIRPDGNTIIKAGVSVETATSYEWTIPDSFTADSWVFRFIPAGTLWVNGGEEISSHIFNIELNATPSTSSTPSSSSSSAPSASPTPSSSVTPSSSPTTPSNSSTPSSSLTPSSSPTQSSSSTPSSSISAAITTAQSSDAAPTSTTSTGTTAVSTSPPVQGQGGGLSPGAKGGIAAGAILGAFLLVGLGYFLARRHHRRPFSEPITAAAVSRAKSDQSPPSGQNTVGGIHSAPPNPAAELSHYPELNHTIAELPAGDSGGTRSWRLGR